MTCSVCGAKNKWYRIPGTDLLRCPNCFNSVTSPEEEPAPKAKTETESGKKPAK